MKIPVKIYIKRLIYVIIVIVLFLSIFVTAFQLKCDKSNSFQLPEKNTSYDAISEKFTSQFPDYSRNEGSTILTYPEWYIVYAYGDYATSLRDRVPSKFPYFGSIRQYWSSYCELNKTYNSLYHKSSGNGLMLMVIGISFSLENGIKGIYENTIGALTEYFSNSQKTQEDIFYQASNEEYAKFVYTEPWYAYHFGTDLQKLWNETDFFGPNFIRKTERKFFITLEYGIKTLYAKLIGSASKSVYSGETYQIYILSHGVKDIEFLIPQITGATFVTSEEGHSLIRVNKYQNTHEALIFLAQHGAQFEKISGNSIIMVTVLSEDRVAKDYPIVFIQKNLVSDMNRYAILVPVDELAEYLLSIKSDRVVLEHIYDY